MLDHGFILENAFKFSRPLKLKLRNRRKRNLIFIRKKYNKIGLQTLIRNIKSFEKMFDFSKLQALDYPIGKVYYSDRTFKSEKS